MLKENIDNTITADNLTIGYTDKKNVKIVKTTLNFKAVKGEFICLIGKNGVGKSTLLKTLSKVLPKIEGTVLIHNKAIELIDQKTFSNLVSVVLTDQLPESNLTVFELVALGRQPHTNWIDKLSKTDKYSIINALRITNTIHLKNNNIFELSDGQLQKVLIARSIAQDTPIIILDEPTAHLDIQHKIETFQLLKRLSKEVNKTIVISTHEIHWAIEMADRIWLMTDSDFYTDTPNNLKSNNRFDELFKSDLVTFDAKTNQFKIS
ncbi:MAG: ABC transporter ATP-binding protein [Bacteroidetes bacterium]|nr:ABC transporter ATP-binding protein [Bacteroidota bacterium]